MLLRRAAAALRRPAQQRYGTQRTQSYRALLYSQHHALRLAPCSLSLQARLLSVAASAPSASHPQPAPIPAATNSPQTLSSLDLLTGDHLKRQEESLHSPASQQRRRRSLVQEAGFRAINDHAMIGNCRTAALIGVDGCIDWYCFPHFDSPSVFAALVDSQRGGHFSIRPVLSSPPYHHQQYEPDTNIVVTAVTNQERERQSRSTERRYRRQTASTAADEQRPQEIAITDYLPMSDDDAAEGLGWLVREVECRAGPVAVDIECFPCMDYGQAEQSVELTRGGGVKFISDSLTAVLTASKHVTWTLSANRRGVFGRLRLQPGEKASLVFRQATKEELTGPVLPHPPAVSAFPSLLDRTRSYWLEWMQQCTYRGRWAESVRRSALALKLLVFAPEGSCVAAPTTSLPETLGGVRNWDYRFAWIRDSSFIIASLLRLGFKQESRAFIGWLQRRMAEMEGGVQGSGLQALYGIRGEKKLEERLLPHLRGYLHSRPVRIGNAAYEQIQLDIYGEALETLHLAHCTGAREMDLQLWRSIRPCIDWIVAHRQDKDEGVWEVRGGKQSFTYSRLQIWVAVDRAIKLAEELIKKYQADPAQLQQEQHTNAAQQPQQPRSSDASEHGAGHIRSHAVTKAQEAEPSQAAGVNTPTEQLRPAPRADGAFTVLPTSLTAPSPPTSSQHTEAKGPTSAHLSAADSPAPSSSSSSSSTSSLLPDDLCEGCNIPAPAPGSPAVTGESQAPPLHISPQVSSSIAPVELFPGLLSSDLEWWRSVRSSLSHQLLHQGYNLKRQAFVQHVATPPHPSTCTVLDAACLAFPLYGFLPPDDPHCTNTVTAVLSPIAEGGLMQNQLVYRYNVSHTKDGFGGEEEGTFALCSNWAIECLARWGACGDEAALQRAVLMMEQMVGLSNHVNLYSEELLLHKGRVHPGGDTSQDQKQKGMLKDDSTKQQPQASDAAAGGGAELEAESESDWPYSEWSEELFEAESDTETRYLQIGNMPQGFSHLAFVNAAIQLNAALDERERRRSSEAAEEQQAPQQQQRLQVQEQQREALAGQ